MNSTDKSKKEPTPEQTEMMDDHTIFTLAICMVNLRMAVLLKDPKKIANCYLKADAAVQSNPGFLERLRKTSEEIATASPPASKIEIVK